jgi:hypothetical protein
VVDVEQLHEALPPGTTYLDADDRVLQRQERRQAFARRIATGDIT